MSEPALTPRSSVTGASRSQPSQQMDQEAQEPSSVGGSGNLRSAGGQREHHSEHSHASVASIPKPPLARNDLGSHSRPLRLTPSQLSPLKRGGGTPSGSLQSRGGNSPASMSRSRTQGAAFAGETDQVSITNEAMIWGTTISLKATMDTFQDFIATFVLPELDADGDVVPSEDADAVREPHYLKVLRDLATSENKGQNVNVDADHILRSGENGRKLYRQLIRYPQDVIPIFDIVLNAEYVKILKESALATENEAAEQDVPVMRARVHNLSKEEQRRMRDLDPTDIDTLVSIRGMVIRTSPMIPDLRRAYFQCERCGTGVDVDVDRGRVEEPNQCAQCGAKHSLARIDNRGTYMDKQLIKLQETPESIPEGETPHTVMLYAFEDLCDAVVPGDRIVITGVYRAIPQRPNPRMRTVKSVFKTYLDVLHFSKVERGRLASEGLDRSSRSARSSSSAAAQAAEGTEAALTAAALRARCEEMSRNESLYEHLATSLAPSIWEMEDIKKGLLMQMFGGVNKDMGREGKIRGELNILLCGDPGSAKSQLLQYVHERAPRGIYTSGKGSSAVGLTASIIKDPDSREPVLESGALVLSDQGICCIDEFDKMNDTTRSILHEVMEQQTVSIAKAGIIATLNARTSILASANPVESRYNPKLSVVENLQLPPTLLSRFDLIYLVLDSERPDADRQLAAHLVTLFQDPSLRAKKSAPYTVAQLTEYISYAKANVNPVISEEARTSIVQGYLDMRRAGLRGGRKTITATTRQLESIIRLSEAHARMRLATEVFSDDVKEAIRLINVATQRAAMDPRTGTINMDLIATGHSDGERDAISSLVEAIREELQIMAPHRKLATAVLFKDLVAKSDGALINKNDFEAALREIANEASPLISLARNQITVL